MHKNYDINRKCRTHHINSIHRTSSESSPTNSQYTTVQQKNKIKLGMQQSLQLMKVSSSKLKTTLDISFAYLLLSPIWLLLQHGYATTLWPTTQFFCVPLYLSNQGSLSVSLHKSTLDLTLDLNPKICNSKHERGHAHISLALTHEKHLEALPMLAKGLISKPLL